MNKTLLRIKTRVETIAGLALFSLLLFSMLAPLFSKSAMNGIEASGEGNLLRQIVYFCLFFVAVISSRLIRLPERLLIVPLSIFLVLIWSTISITWAINSGVGARRLALTLIVIISIFLLVQSCGYKRTLQVVRILLFIMLGANYVAVIGWPEFGIHQAATETDPSIIGAWRGMLLQKNYAGAACSFTILFFILDAQKIPPWFKWPVLASAAIFLLKTESKTSISLLLISVCLGGASLAYNARYRNLLLSVLACLFVLVSFLTKYYWEVIAAPFSREDTLTGRVQIWPPLFQFWQEHWLLGSGFGSFWNIGSPEPIAAYTNGWVAQISSGHNGYLDLLVQIGLPGLILAVIAVLFAPMLELLNSKKLSRSRRGLLFSLVIFGIGHNFTESSLFDRDATVHVFLMLTIALLRLESQTSDEEIVVMNH